MVVISLTTEAGLFKSMIRLWILISNLSQVLVPSPQGDFLVLTVKTLVGSLTGPLTRRSFFFAPAINSEHTFKNTIRLFSSHVTIKNQIYLFLELSSFC